MSFDRKVKRGVLEVVIDLDPNHLTPSELVLKMTGERDESEVIRHAIRDLKGCGLLRLNGEVVEPTHAALCAFELLTGP